MHNLKITLTFHSSARTQDRWSNTGRSTRGTYLFHKGNFKGAWTRHTAGVFHAFLRSVHKRIVATGRLGQNAQQGALTAAIDPNQGRLGALGQDKGDVLNLPSLSSIVRAT